MLKFMHCMIIRHLDALEAFMNIVEDRPVLKMAAIKIDASSLHLPPWATIQNCPPPLPTHSPMRLALFHQSLFG